MNHKLLFLATLAALAAAPAYAEQWTNDLDDNDFVNWGNWVLDNTTTNPTSWNASTNNWQVNLSGDDKAVIGPGQSATGLNRNVLVGDAESGFGGPDGQVGELLVDGGALGISRNLRLGRDTVTGSGTVTVTGGGTVDIGYGLYVGQTANAGSTFNLIDGVVDVTTNSGRSDGLSVGHREFGSGSLNISGGQLNVLRGNAYFSDNGNPGVATSALNLSGSGVLDVQDGYVSFGGNSSAESGAVTVTATISDSSSLKAKNARFGFGADSDVTLTMSAGTLDIPTGFITMGQAAGASVTVDMSGGVINADRMVFANFAAVPGDPDAEPPVPELAAAESTMTMTGGTVNVIRSGQSTSSNTGAFLMGPGESVLNISGDAVIHTEKLWFASGGLLTLGENAAIHVSGSTDGVNPTFDFTVADLEGAGEAVLGQVAFNGGTFRIAGATDPVSGVNYVDLLTAAIQSGVIYTEVGGVMVVAEFVAGPPLPVLQIAPAGTDLTISWDQPAGQEALLEYNADLGGVWTPLGTFETGGEPESLDYTDTTWDPQAAPRFYRLQVGGGYTQLVLQPFLVM
jgi:hypothetical protein